MKYFPAASAAVGASG